MKKFLFQLWLVLLFCTLITSLPVHSENLLNSFEGGVHNMIFMQNSSLTSGMGVYEAAAGIGITTLRPTPASIYWNPAGLAFLSKGRVLIEALPKFSYAPDISETLNEEVDAALEDFEQDTLTSIVYPDFSLEGGQEAQSISSIALAFPFQNMFFGVAYQSAYSLNLNMISSGVENMITSLEENPDDNATIFTRTDINMFLSLDADMFSIAAGRQITNKLGAGITISRINVNTTINGLLAPEGVFTRRGIEKSFNNPASGWQNDFYSSMIGDFNGGAWAAKLGVAYHPINKVSLNLLMNFTGDMTLDGNMEITQYFYPALNLDADADEETFDLDNIENFAQPTETVLADNAPDDQLKLNTPSSIAFGAAYRGISLTFTSYSGELSYAFDLARDGIPATYSRGFKPKMGFLMGFDLRYLRLSVGGITGDEVVSGYKDSEGVPVEPSVDIIIPRFSMGSGFSLTEKWDMDILFFALPDLLGTVCKVGFTYTF